MPGVHKELKKKLEKHVKEHLFIFFLRQTYFKDPPPDGIKIPDDVDPIFRSSIPDC